MAEVKFCGLTRIVDVERAVMLGARYAGVVLTTSPRRVTPEAARELLAPCDGSLTLRVGVFGSEPLADVVRAASRAGVHVVQLHGAREAGDYPVLRDELGVETWRVTRVGDAGLKDDTGAFVEGDATLLDTLLSGVQGGSGIPFDWHSVAGELQAMRGARRIILAGGLRPSNVGDAVSALLPDVVDVSSGVESSPGVKDHALMEEFMRAAALEHRA